MADPLSIYRAPALVCARDLVFRTTGLRYSVADVIETLESVNATTARLHVQARDRLANEALGRYLGEYETLIQKASIRSILPQDLTFGGPYPTTFERFQQYIESAYGWRLDSGDFGIRLEDGTVRVLETGALLDMSPDNLNRLILVVRNESLKWIGGEQIEIVLTQLPGGIFDPLRITSEAPDGVVGRPYSHLYGVVGGRPPYSWRVVSGQAPAALNPDTGVLGPIALHPGPLSWRVEVQEGDGVRAVFDDTAVMTVDPLTLRVSEYTEFCSTSFNHPLVFEGGVKPYSITVLNTLPEGVRLQNNSLQGVMHTGRHTIEIQCVDAESTIQQESIQLIIVDRPVQTVANSLFDKLISFNPFDESPIESGTELKDLHGNAPLYANGEVVRTTLARDGAARLQGGHLFGGVSRHLFDSSFGVSFFIRGSLQAARTFMSKWGAQAGWSLTSDPSLSGRMVFDIHLETTGTWESRMSELAVLDGETHFVCLSRQNNWLEFARDLVIEPRKTLPAGPATFTLEHPFTVGVRGDLQDNTRMQFDMDSLMFFSGPLWSDEQQYLYNAGLGRTYQQIKNDANR